MSTRKSLYCLERIAVSRGVLPELSCLFVPTFVHVEVAYRLRDRLKAMEDGLKIRVGVTVGF